MLKRKMHGTIFVDIQAVETTNAKLSNAGFYNGKVLTPIDMCNILGVDGILTSNYSFSETNVGGGCNCYGSPYWRVGYDK